METIELWNSLRLGEFSSSALPITLAWLLSFHELLEDQQEKFQLQFAMLSQRALIRLQDEKPLFDQT